MLELSIALSSPREVIREVPNRFPQVLWRELCETLLFRKGTARRESFARTQGMECLGQNPKNSNVRHVKHVVRTSPAS